MDHQEMAFSSNNLHPSVWECLQAQEVFSCAVMHYMENRDMSRSIIIKCALTKVWEAARSYQIAKDGGGTNSEIIDRYFQIAQRQGIILTNTSAKGVPNTDS